eukprot:64759-Prymnesium_polylepis.1
MGLGCASVCCTRVCCTRVCCTRVCCTRGARAACVACVARGVRCAARVACVGGAHSAGTSASRGSHEPGDARNEEASPSSAVGSPTQ